jgi:hypothetical protein
MFRLKVKSLGLLSALSALRTKALRSGVWFASLSYEDRVLASMIHKNVRIVKNATLATVIARIMGKLFYALTNSTFLKRIDGIGRPLAKAYSEKAVSMGNNEAANWMNDKNYIMYLGTMALHDPMNSSMIGKGARY